MIPVGTSLRARIISGSRSCEIVQQQLRTFSTAMARSAYHRNALQCKRNSLLSMSTSSLSSSITSLTSITINSTTTNARFAHDDYSDQYPPLQKVPITFIDWSGMRHDIEAVEGQTLLQAAREWDVPMIGVCNGGDTSPMEFGHGGECGSCMLFVPKSHQHVFKTPTMEERIVLQTQRVPINDQTRLGCEIVVTPAMAGCTFLLAEPLITHLEHIIPDVADYRLDEDAVYVRDTPFEESHVVAQKERWVTDEAKDQAKRFIAYQEKAMKKTTKWTDDRKTPFFLPVKD